MRFIATETSSFSKLGEGQLLRTTLSSGVRFQWARPRSNTSYVHWILLISIANLIAGTFLYFGSGETRLNCVKNAGGTDCSISRIFLTQTWSPTRIVTQIKRAELEQIDTDEDLMTRVVLRTAEGVIPLERGSSNFGHVRKRHQIRDVNQFINDDARTTWTASFSQWNLFGFMGGMIFMLSVSAPLIAAAARIFPLFLQWDASRNVFSYRANIFQPLTKIIPRDDIVMFGIAPYLGRVTLSIRRRDGTSVAFKTWNRISRIAFENLIGEFAPLVGRRQNGPYIVEQEQSRSLEWISKMVPAESKPVMQLPLVIDEGSDSKKKFGILLGALTLVYFACQYYVFVEGNHADLGAWILGFALLGVAKNLITRQRFTISENQVECKATLFYGKTKWIEPKSNYISIDLVEIANDESGEVNERKTYHIILVHKFFRKRDVRLSRQYRMLVGEALEMQREYCSLLNLHNLGQQLAKASHQSMPSELWFERTSTGGCRISWPAVKIKPLLFIGLFFSLLGLVAVATSVAILGESWAGIIPLIFGAIFFCIGATVASSYFLAREMVEISGGKITHSAQFLRWKKADKTRNLSEIKDIHMLLLRNERKRSRYLSISGDGFSIKVAQNVSNKSQDWLIVKLTELIKGGQSW